MYPRAISIIAPPPPPFTLSVSRAKATICVKLLHLAWEEKKQEKNVGKMKEKKC